MFVYQYCSICGSTEHTKRTCPHRPVGKNKCSICGERGHNKQTCPKKYGEISYSSWESSYAKWDRDLWDILRETLRDSHMKSGLSENRVKVWLMVLGDRCAYCDRYMDEDLLVDVGLGMSIRNKCLKCPLHHNHACSHTINDNHLIGRMLKAWVNIHKGSFESAREQLLHELRRTKFSD